LRKAIQTVTTTLHALNGFYKHKLLLDEKHVHRTAFPNLNSQFDVKHVADDLKQSGLDESGRVPARSKPESVSW